MDAVPPEAQRGIALAVARLEKVDPRAERRAARALHTEAALARHLEARARLRGRVLAPQPVARARKSH